MAFIQHINIRHPFNTGNSLRRIPRINTFEELAYHVVRIQMITA